MINIVIAEDHNSLIEGIELFFKFEDDIQIVGKVNDGLELLDLLKKKHVNVVITDIRMPNMDGIEVTRYIKKEYPYIKVIAFTMFEQKEAIRKMMDAGARGYLLKNSSLKILLESIRKVDTGDFFYDPNITLDDKQSESNINKKQKGILTKRQLQILELIGERKTTNEIAELLFIGKLTVATHRKNIIQKLNLSGQNALLSYAIKKRYDFD